MKLLKDEKKWLEEETKPIGKIHPFFRKSLLAKTLLFLLLIILTFKYPHFFLTIIFSLIVSYIKFKRMKYEIPMELEPSYFFMVVLTLSYGFWYGAAFLIITIFPALFRGVSFGLLINTLSKFLVMLASMTVWHFKSDTNLVIYIVLMMVFLIDLLSYKPRILSGQPIHEILLNLFSNTLIRYIYFSFFFIPLMAFLA